MRRDFPGASQRPPPRTERIEPATDSQRRRARLQKHEAHPSPPKPQPRMAAGPAIRAAESEWSGGHGAKAKVRADNGLWWIGRQRRHAAAVLAVSEANTYPPHGIIGPAKRNFSPPEADVRGTSAEAEQRQPSRVSVYRRRSAVDAAQWRRSEAVRGAIRANFGESRTMVFSGCGRLRSVSGARRHRRRGFPS